MQSLAVLIKKFDRRLIEEPRKVQRAGVDLTMALRIILETKQCHEHGEQRRMGVQALDKFEAVRASITLSEGTEK